MALLAAESPKFNNEFDFISTLTIFFLFSTAKQKLYNKYTFGLFCYINHVIYCYLIESDWMLTIIAGEGT